MRESGWPPQSTALRALRAQLCYKYDVPMEAPGEEKTHGPFGHFGDWAGGFASAAFPAAGAMQLSRGSGHVLLHDRLRPPDLAFLRMGQCSTAAPQRYGARQCQRETARLGDPSIESLFGGGAASA